MKINTDKLIEACDIITRNIMFLGHDGKTYWQKPGFWLFDLAMRALDTDLEPVSVTYGGRCRQAGDVYVTVRRDGTYAIRRKETADKYGVETW